MLYSVVLVTTFISSVLSQHTCDTEACVLVTNECPFNLYLQRQTIDGDENTPSTITEINSNGGETVLDVSGWKDLAGQRLYAWWSNPIGQNLHPLEWRDKVEINLCPTSTEPNRMCYNPTAVDYFGLPVTMGPYNQNDCPSVPYTGQDTISVADVSNLCPTQYITTGSAGVCKSPYHICVGGSTDALCSHLDSKVTQCINEGNCESGVTTTQAYGCSDWFGSQPDICAALNRGVYPTNDQSDASKFYVNEPYSSYAKFVHTNGAKHYAFAYDDVGGQGTSGYNVCQTNFLSVTFCPN